MDLEAVLEFVFVLASLLDGTMLNVGYYERIVSTGDRVSFDV